jgi:hypothetical protein
MGIGTSIFLLAIGAIFTFAVHYDFGTVSLQTIGIILMAAGALGLIISLFLWGGFANRRTVVEDREVIRERRPHDHDHVTY